MATDYMLYKDALLLELARVYEDGNKGSVDWEKLAKTMGIDKSIARDAVKGLLEEGSVRNVIPEWKR